jgi:hypothetical protein
MTITWATLIINAVIALVSAGGVGWIITAREDKKQKQLENKQKEQEIEEHKKDEVIKDWKEIAEERRKRCEELKLDCDKKDEKLVEKDNIISDLRAKLDARNTYCAVSEMLRCEKVACTDRKPPYGMKEIKLDDTFES